MRPDLALGWRLVLHLTLTGLPIVAVLLVAVRRGLRDVPLLLGTGLAVSGAAAMVTFWAFWVDPLLGRVTSFAVVAGSLLAIALSRPHRLDRRLLLRLAVPLLLWGFASLFVVYLGFLHGGSGQPLATATTRFSHQLPTDNEIPAYFAGWYYEHGHSAVPPPYGDWLSSDRPPLQVGYTLAQRPFGWDLVNLHYQVLAVVLQQLWVVAMWALLVAARVRPVGRGLAMVALLVSDIAIVHGFFVWPKLIAAAFLLAALALALPEGWASRRRNPWVLGLFAGLCALSMLAHGASAFALVPLVVFAARRGIPGWRPLLAAVLVAVALLAPWTAYQRWVDPPGDRLVKWQIGGSPAIDDRGAVETIVDSYQAAGWDGSLALKRGNVTGLVHAHDTEALIRALGPMVDQGKWRDAVANLRYARFFWLLPCLGLLLLGAGALAVGLLRRRVDRRGARFALASLGLSVAVTAVWVLLMFGSAESATIIHQGTLFLPLLAGCALVVGAHAAFPRFAVVLTAVNAVFVLALYVPALSPPPGSSYSVLAGVLAAVGLVGFGCVALRPDPLTDPLTEPGAAADQPFIAADG